MGWKLKTIIALTLCFFVAACCWLGYVVYAHYQGNEYALQLTAALNAASLVNGNETFTAPERAVISTYEGRQYVIVPENYKAIGSLLRKQHVMPPFRRVGKDAPLSIVICDSAVVRVEPDTVDGAMVSLETDRGRRFTMHVRGGNIWRQILEYTTTGHAGSPNIPL